MASQASNHMLLVVEGCKHLMTFNKKAFGMAKGFVLRVREWDQKLGNTEPWNVSSIKVLVDGSW